MHAALPEQWRELKIIPVLPAASGFLRNGAPHGRV